MINLLFGLDDVAGMGTTVHPALGTPLPADRVPISIGIVSI